MDSPHRRHLPLRPFLCSIAGLINLLALLWLFGGGQLFLFISRTQGFWFDGFYGVFTGAMMVLAIFATFFSRRTLSLTRSDMMVFLGFVVSLLIPAMLSEKINAADPDAVRKFLMLLPYAFVPGLWGMVFRKEMIKGRTLFRLSLMILFIGNLFLFRYYYETTLAHFRAGTESNAIGLSYAFANLWVLVLGSSLLRKRIFLFSLASIIAPINVFLLSTRQSLVYIIIAVFLLWFFWMLPFSIGKKPAIFITLSKRRTRTLTLALFLLIVFFASLQPVGLALGRSNTVKNSFETASARWSGFFQRGYADEARERLFKEAADVWKDKPILGEFHYHDTPGSYAHHMLMDFLAQYGLLGFTAYLTLIFVALSKILKSEKDNPLDISFALMFVALLFVGITVTQFTTNPIFHFLLFYWVGYKSTPTKEQII